MERVPTKIFYIVYQVLKVLLTRICKVESLDLSFILVFISFYISRYDFSQVFRRHSALSEKKIFFTNFPFLTDSLKSPPHHPLKSENPLSVTKVFCQGSLTYHGFSILLCYDDGQDSGYPKTFIYGRKTFIGATRYSIDFFKWL